MIEQYWKSTYERLCHHGLFGDPNGRPAYAYIRVSTDIQANESSSGLHRQIERIYDVCMRESYYVPLENVYADDASGFSLDRPELKRLMRESAASRRGYALLAEEASRLSRRDWHFGYLKEKVFGEERGMPVHFWDKASENRIVQSVMSAINQEGMLAQLEKCKEGKLKKAQNGFVTATSQAALGYRKSATGNKKSTTYVLHVDEAAAVRWIYEQIGYQGQSMRQMGSTIPQRFPFLANRSWCHQTIRQLIANRVYKGQFIANRSGRRTEQILQSDGTFKNITRRYERPESEWKVVRVPPIVSEELWALANENLAKNKALASRNAKRQYLLTGLLKCATCGYSWNGGYYTPPKGKGTPYLAYRCSSKILGRKADHCPVCDQPARIRAEMLEKAVFDVVRRVILDPQLLIDHLEDTYHGEANQHLYDQIRFIQDEIRAAEHRTKADQELYYAGGYRNAQEYAGVRRAHEDHIAALNDQIAKLEKQVLSPEMLAAQKDRILRLAEKASRYQQIEIVPFEIKRQLIKTAVNKITIDAKNGRFSVEGEINGTYTLVLKQIAVEGLKDVSIVAWSDEWSCLHS